jgi:hypothetical protein
MLGLLLIVGVVGADDSAYIEGRILAPGGSPAKGVRLSIASLASSEHSQTLVAPIITKNAVGVIGVSAPPVVNPKYLNYGIHVDKTGHYRVKLPAKYTRFEVVIDCCHAGALLDRYTDYLHIEPMPAIIDIHPGEKLTRDFTLVPFTPVNASPDDPILLRRKQSK